ncbi:MAG: hypothetical protein ACPLSX_02640, partial [Arcobacter sp.]
YLGSTVWEMAHNNTDFREKALTAKEAGDVASAKKYIFFRRVQSEAQDYVLNVLNPIFKDLDKWLEKK